MCVQFPARKYPINDLIVISAERVHRHDSVGNCFRYEKTEGIFNFSQVHKTSHARKYQIISLAIRKRVMEYTHDVI